MSLNPLNNHKIKKKKLAGRKTLRRAKNNNKQSQEKR